MGYRFIKQYYEMKQNNTFENNNNRKNKSKTIRRGFFMKFFLNFLFVINGIFGSVSAQQYPVRLVPVVFPPYNVRLSDYALNSEPKLQLQVLMTDLLEPPHKTGIKFSLESGGRVIAVSNPFINGLEPFMLQPGNNISLSNLDLKPLFKLENLSGISPSNYARALPDGLYQYCFQAYDFYTKNNLSQKSCASVYQVLYEPPFLNLPQKGEKVTKKAEFQGVVFNWSPRQLAPNTKYIFTLKEIWDNQRDPVSAFLAARVLWKEESFAPSLYYGVDKTQLIPGKRYAWQVQAVSGTPQYNHSPIQEGGVYKNNGLSEIFFFDYVENCPVPAFLMAKNAARGRAEIQWMLQGASSKQFRVEYRKKGSSSPWLSETSYQTSAILSGLENNTEYEYRVGAVCGENKSFDPNDLSQADAFAYSGVQYFTTNFSNQNKNSAQCGVMPHVDLANKKLYDRQLTPNEVFTAGDFPVTVITAQGTAGNYTGEGFIQVPYLADTKIKVKFNNIQLNSDKQLINGTVETEYDANESAVHYASAGLGEIFGDKGIKDIKINYKIEKITLVMTPAPGVLRIVGIDPNGENKGPVQELPAGRDYTITDSSGKIWQVDEQGTVTEGEKIAQSGKSNADNTEGVKTSASGNISEITQYSANGVAIKWISMEDSHFYFDTPDITKIPFDRYPQVKDTKGRNIVIPYKAVVKGQKEFIGARIIIEDPKLKEAKIEFKVLGSGKLINAELISNTGNQREYKLELKGVFSYGEEEIMAVLLPSENQQKTNKEDKKQKELKEAKQKIIGSFRLVHLEPKNVNLSLVPLDKASEAELDTIAKNIHNTYSRAGINFDIKKQPVLDISAITTKDIDTPDDNPLSHYSKMQQSINRLYPAKINEYVLFITEKASSTGQKGFMPLGGQYGYAYKSKDKNTPAHELGHGVFRLEHPWSNKLIKTPRASTNLLMDYAGAAELSHFDWKQINDPKIKIYTFQKQEEGELALHENEYLGFAPNGRVITNKPKIFKYDSYFITGFHSSNGIYIWDGNVYRKGNDVFTPIDKPITGKVAIWVNSKNPNCYAWYKFIEVKNYTAKDFNKIKNLIKKDNGKGWTADLVHNASESCITKSKKEQEEGIVIPELVGNQNYYKIENTLQQAKASFGSNADIEFSHNGKVYKQNDNGKVEEVKNALSTEQINNGEWGGNVKSKIRLTTDEKNIVQVEAFGLNKNIKIKEGKKAKIKDVSDNIREKTNAFLKENNVKDLNATYSNDTGTFADGDKIKINGSFGKIISEGIEVTTELLGEGQIKEQVYLSSSKAAIHAPGVVTGSVEVAAQKVTDLTSLGKLVYDVATDKQTRADIADQFQNIKDQIGDNPKEFFPILGEVILTVGTGNTSEDWDKSVNSKDNGEKSHLATRGVGNTVITLISGVAIVKELPEIADKLGDAIKKVKKAGNFIKNGKFIDELLEADYQKYLTRKSKQGKAPKDRLEWKESRDYWLNDSPMARGNKFNETAKNGKWYEYSEVHLENGKRLDSYDAVKGEIVSRKATDLESIELSTFESYLKEMKNKYSAGIKIRSDKYKNQLDGKVLKGRQILEIPESNKNFDKIQDYIDLAKNKYNIEIRFRPE